MSGKKKENTDGRKIIATNRKARFNFELFDRYECGLALQGTEVKSLRAGQVSLTESYAEIQNGEIWLVGANIPPYEFGNRSNHEPTRRRKLLLHRQEILKLQMKVAERGFTLAVLSLYFLRGKAKAEIALAKGKRNYDKRETIKRRDQEREAQRDVKDY